MMIQRRWFVGVVLIAAAASVAADYHEDVLQDLQANITELWAEVRLLQHELSSHLHQHGQYPDGDDGHRYPDYDGYHQPGRHHHHHDDSWQQFLTELHDHGVGGAQPGDHQGNSMEGHPEHDTSDGHNHEGHDHGHGLDHGHAYDHDDHFHGHHNFHDLPHDVHSRGYHGPGHHEIPHHFHGDFPILSEVPYHPNLGHHFSGDHHHNHHHHHDHDHHNGDDHQHEEPSDSDPEIADASQEIDTDSDEDPHQGHHHHHGHHPISDERHQHHHHHHGHHHHNHLNGLPDENVGRDGKAIAMCEMEQVVDHPSHRIYGNVTAVDKGSLKINVNLHGFDTNIRERHSYPSYGLLINTDCSADPDPEDEKYPIRYLSNARPHRRTGRIRGFIRIDDNFEVDGSNSIFGKYVVITDNEEIADDDAIENAERTLACCRMRIVPEGRFRFNG